MKQMPRALRRFTTFWTTGILVMVLACAIYHVYFVAPTTQLGLANMLKVLNPTNMVTFLRARFFMGDTIFFLVSFLWALHALAACILAERIDKRP